MISVASLLISRTFCSDFAEVLPDERLGPIFLDFPYTKGSKPNRGFRAWVMIIIKWGLAICTFPPPCDAVPLAGGKDKLTCAGSDSVVQSPR